MIGAILACKSTPYKLKRTYKRSDRKMTEHELIDQYPKLFKKSKRSTIIANYGLQCDQGWILIIDQLCRQLSALAQEMQLTVKKWPYFLQIKEKFGTLRTNINMSGLKDEASQEKVWRFIQQAAEASSVTCERCGNAGTFRNSSWMHTYCDACESHYVSTIKGSGKFE
ncbi:MAG: hypothetical protein ACO1N8_03015 [Methylophilus sp.]